MTIALLMNNELIAHDIDKLYKLEYNSAGVALITNAATAAATLCTDLHSMSQRIFFGQLVVDTALTLRLLSKWVTVESWTID